jgi:hypothetical protein
MNNADKPTCPTPHINSDGRVQFDIYLGLTKREYFAGLAMQGLLVNYKEHCHFGNDEWQPMVSELAVKCADELLKQLEQPTNE